MQKKAIALLSAGVKKNKQGKWETTTLYDFYPEAPGNKIRVRATYLYWKHHDDYMILTSGGLGCGVKKEDKDRLFLSTILKNELIELGVVPDAIIEESKSSKTYQQLIEIDKLIEDKQYAEIFIITNSYHIDRVQEMIKVLDLQNRDKFKILSAEEICLHLEPGVWEDEFKKAYDSKDMKKIIAAEQNGIRQLKDGTYEF